MTIDSLKERAYKTAVKRGQYPKCPVCEGRGCTKCSDTGTVLGMDLLVLLEQVRQELREAEEAFLDCNFAPPVRVKVPEDYEKEYKDTFESEMADVFITLGSICEYLGVDIQQHIEWKLHYNATRKD